MGSDEGCPVGNDVGDIVGAFVGAAVGEAVGVVGSGVVGDALDGTLVGAKHAG